MESTDVSSLWGQGQEYRQKGINFMLLGFYNLENTDMEKLRKIHSSNFLNNNSFITCR